MAKEQKPHFYCQTNDRPNSVVEARCKRTCKVTYRFAFRSKLSLPYAVAIDGKVLPAFRDKPKLTDGKIPVVVEAGQTVELYLNSDAHPSFRHHPVYLVKTAEEDVDVVITEAAGKHADSDTPIRGRVSKDEATGLSVQHMTAKLTGDIWMKVSHKYTPEEVDARIPAGTSEEVKSAVKSIYKGLSAATLMIERPGEGAKRARALTVTFADSSNPKEHITKYSLLSDGLTRVHPGGYAALINAAMEAGVSSISVSSCWRPMLGSIAHRAGLGLDVSVLGGTAMDRQELRRSLNASRISPRGNANDKDNVTDAEVKAFGQYEHAVAERRRAEAEKAASDKAMTDAIKSNSDAAVQPARERQSKAMSELRDATRIERESRRAWDQARDSGEPVHVRQYRLSLLKCVCVRQLFDPWFMNANVRDALESEPNLQKSSNEKLHAHHLHITVDEPKIL